MCSSSCCFLQPTSGTSLSLLGLRVARGQGQKLVAWWCATTSLNCLNRSPSTQSVSVFQRQTLDRSVCVSGIKYVVIQPTHAALIHI